MAKRVFHRYFIIFFILILAAGYAISRLTNLTAMPIFTDEAIYIRWAQIGGRDASWRFISLTDGKQPMFTWALMLMLRLVPGDPLFVGRLTSVFSGLLGMIGMGIAGATIFRRTRIGVIAAFLYLISPFTLLYDRMALYDSMVAMFSIWNITLGFWLVRSNALSAALLSGFTLGLGMLNKTSGFLSLYLMPTFALLADFPKKGWVRKLSVWIVLVLLAAGVSQVVYSILRLSPYFYIVGQKDTTFVYAFSDWITHPWTFFWGNLHGIWDWTKTYGTIPLLIAAAASYFLSFRYTKEKIILLSWYVIPACGLALFGKVLYPRFVLFMVMPLLLLAAFSLDYLLENIRRKWIAWVIFALICFQSVWLSFSIVKDIRTAPIARSDSGQYVNDWPSGWGVKETVQFFKEKSEKEPIAIYTEGTFGLLPFAFEIYLGDNPNIEIHGIWPIHKEIPPEIASSVLVKRTYFVTYQSGGTPDWNLTKLLEYQKGVNETSVMRVYEVQKPVVK